MDAALRRRDWADASVRKLRTTSTLLISDSERRLAAQRDLSPVMFDTLGRLCYGGHSYPTRVKALVDRGLVADDGGLTDKGLQVIGDLGIVEGD